MKVLKWLYVTQVLLVIFAVGNAEAQAPRRRTLLVVPNQPAEKAPQILVHKDIATTLVFEEEPKAVKLEAAEGRIKVDQTGKLVIIVPLVELGNRERLILTVTAPDNARFVFGLQDGFNTEVDSQVIIRRGKASAESAHAESFVTYILARDREELREVAYRRQPDRKSDEIYVEGAVTALDFAFVLVNIPGGIPPSAHVRLHGKASGELEIIGLQEDQNGKGFKIAVKKPTGELDAEYTLEIAGGATPTLVNPEVKLWPTAAVQRTWKK